MTYEDLKNLLKINNEKLDDELCEQSAMFMFVAELYINAEKNYEDKKLELEQVEVELDNLIRKEFEEEGKKATEKMIDALIKRNPKIRQLKQELNNLRAKRDLLKNLKLAWYARKDCLIQVAINKRAEMEHLNTDVKETGIADLPEDFSEADVDIDFRDL